MASLFVKRKLVDPYIIAIDSTSLRAKGHLWHKSSMTIKAIPIIFVVISVTLIPIISYHLGAIDHGMSPLFIAQISERF